MVNDYLIQFKDNTDKIKYVTVKGNNIEDIKRVVCSALQITSDKIMAVESYTDIKRQGYEK